ncbi:MAG TPA: lysophospholipid acyltransferase family protein [Pyrinomonadaceae bacterium]|jgi:1-acyl-sn-glycerol-3-phosphate acyltransferase|nr:lysophospholipid acyltransferase family protein [Pyrinomonadaceae bacterium]
MTTRTREGITRSAGDPAGSPPPRTPPPGPPSPLNYLHSAVAVPLVYLYTVVMGTLSLLLSVRDPGGRRQHWCASTWSRMIARTAGMGVRVHGAGRLREGASYVFLSTHQSYMDIPAMLGYIPAQLRIAAKREVFQIPFLGWHMRRAGHISINRGSTQEAVETLRRAAREIEPGISVFLYPEGTRSRDGSLQPFKKGGFKFALQTGLPVVPITIVGTRRVLPRDSFVFRPGPVDLYLDAPIPTSGLTDSDLPALMRDVREAMEKHFKEVDGRR